MRILLLVLSTSALLGCLVLENAIPVGRAGRFATTPSAISGNQARASALQPDSLCAKNEHIIFSCSVKRTAKVVALCASPELTKDRGYLQYRFGLPGKIELEFPKDREGSQQKFRYSHYFRYQVDRTEITFEINGYEYSIFDDYEGEEKPRTSSQGVTVTAPGKPKDLTLVCHGRAKVDYDTLDAILPNDSQ